MKTKRKVDWEMVRKIQEARRKQRKKIIKGCKLMGSIGGGDDTQAEA